MTFPSTTGGKMDWNHGMCECSGDIGTCITGVFCPCILDSRTAYRLNRRSEKQDPTDLLGFKSCNSRCTVMSIFGICGLCCMSTFPLPPLTYHANFMLRQVFYHSPSALESDMPTNFKEMWAQISSTAVAAVVAQPYKTSAKSPKEKTSFVLMQVLRKHKHSIELVWDREWFMRLREPFKRSRRSQPGSCEPFLGAELEIEAEILLVEKLSGCLKQLTSNAPISPRFAFDKTSARFHLAIDTSLTPEV